MDKLCRVFEVNYEQAKALDINNNTALRAGAGSGKTRVLIKRFVRYLLEIPTIFVDDIVAITFTRKAAMEMQNRVRRELTDRISKMDDTILKKRLADIRMNITNGNIDTIHGFCTKILRENFAVLGIAPDFNVMEETDKTIITSKVFEHVFNGFVEDEDSEGIMEYLVKYYPVTFFLDRFKRGVLSAFDSAREQGLEFKGSSFSPKSFGNGQDLVNSAENCTKLLEEVALTLLERLDREYKDYKQREGLLDFNDLEILTYDLLGNDEIREMYLERFKVIMVDEFQDVNPLQKKIIDRLIWVKGEIPAGRLFIVGDHKQSIYGFRGSDYRILEETCGEISRFGSVKTLNNCYRSTKSIIDIINAVFSQLLYPYEKLEFPGTPDKTGGEIELITWEKGLPKRDRPKTRWELAKSLLLSDELAENLNYVLRDKYPNTVILDRKSYQGEVIAGVINMIIKRGYEYRDVAILLRNRASLLEIENALVESQIPYSVIGGIGFWDRQEIKDILSLYRLVFYPKDLLSLYTVLRSPIFGFSDDLLLSFSAFIKGQNGEGLGQLMSGFVNMASQEEQWIVERAAKVLGTLGSFGGVLGPSELMDKIVELTSYNKILLGLRQGEKKFRNVEKLLKIVEEFEGKGLYNARELISYLGVLEQSGGLDAEAFIDSDGGNAVKILTIHASKGLEFEAVLIPDMDRNLDLQTKKNKPLFFIDGDKKVVGMGLDENQEFDEQANPKYKELYEEKLKREMEDSKRLLYVGMTRAKKYLALIGEKQNVGENEDIDKQNSFMKQLMWAIMKRGSAEGITFIDAQEVRAKEEYGL
ncbi:MAG: UvrD-helicase domain-containing protein [Clostridium sp.]|nr:UvrD-helicase domain-containing protein [Clostridium sp.]